MMSMCLGLFHPIQEVAMAVIQAPQTITSESSALAAWYGSHAAIRQMWALRNARTLRVVVILEPTSIAAMCIRRGWRTAMRKSRSFARPPTASWNWS